METDPVNVPEREPLDFADLGAVVALLAKAGASFRVSGVLTDGTAYDVRSSDWGDGDDDDDDDGDDDDGIPPEYQIDLGPDRLNEFVRKLKGQDRFTPPKRGGMHDGFMWHPENRLN